MVKRTYSKYYNEEPEQAKFDLPSEKEHLFQVTDVITFEDELGTKLRLDPDTVSVKLEVVGGEEQGRTLLQRLSLDENWKGFFATRLFLKAIGEPYKGAGLEIDTDRWIGRQVYATVVHNGKFANIDQYNLEKRIEQYKSPIEKPITDPADIKWGE
jgi:hypothetical protein